MGYLVSAVLLLFSSALYAAQAEDGLLSISLHLILVASIISLAGGISSTLQRINHNYQLPLQKRKIINIYLDVTTSIFTSLCAGLLMFALLDGTNIRPMFQGALIFLAGWGGSKTLDDAFQKYVLKKP